MSSTTTSHATSRRRSRATTVRRRAPTVDATSSHSCVRVSKANVTSSGFNRAPIDRSMRFRFRSMRFRFRSMRFRFRSMRFRFRSTPIDRCVSSIGASIPCASIESPIDHHRSIDRVIDDTHRSIEHRSTRIDANARTRGHRSIDRSMVHATRDTDRSIDRHERGDRSERTQGSIRWMVKGRHRSIDRSIDRHRVDVVHVHVHVHSAHARATSGPTTASTRSRGLRAHRLNLISG